MTVRLWRRAAELLDLQGEGDGVRNVEHDARPRPKDTSPLDSLRRRRRGHLPHGIHGWRQQFVHHRRHQSRQQG
ncbi:MAG: hypothetical protein QOF42_2471 [Gammaproteobacteria bacterium]|jgi:hypothetical protein|nr:hypothetical protein [Gammaproteobacteria bacterium]